MPTNNDLTLPGDIPLDSVTRKLLAVLFYLVTSAFALFFLWMSIYALTDTLQWHRTNETSHRVHPVAPDDIARAFVFVFLLIAMNISFLTLSTTMLIRTFRLRLWLDEKGWDRYWSILIWSFLILFFVGGCFAYTWLGIALTAMDS